jgi:hypothetical protein
MAEMSWGDLLRPQKQVGHFEEGQLPPQVSLRMLTQSKDNNTYFHMFFGSKELYYYYFIN